MRDTEKSLVALKRKVYLGALALCTTLLGLDHLLLKTSDTSLFEQVFFIGLLACIIGLFVLLWRKPKAAPTAEAVVFTVMALYFAGKLAYTLYSGALQHHPERGLLDVALWVPLVYAWAFLSFGGKRGLVASLLFFSICLIIGASYMVQSGLAGQALALPELSRLGEFYLASVTYLVTLYVFAYFLERHMEAQLQAEAVAQHAYTDALTGLPNRLLLKDRLSQAIARAQRSGEVVAVLFMDLDRFKLINDTFGHQAGDTLLQEVTQRLQTSIREVDTLARMSGDEFVFVITQLSSVQDVHVIVPKLLLAFKAPFILEGRPLFVSASIGVSVYPSNSSSVDKLLLQADTAMYQAKGEGKDGYALFTENMGKLTVERLDTEQRLHQALEKQEFKLHYQPIMNTETGKIVSLEALLRWKHPERGFILPGSFIAVAEESRMIVPIGTWVLREACRQNKRWREQGYAPMRVAVNVSAIQFAQNDFVAIVAAALRDSGLEPQWLELELTESTIIHEAANQRIQELKDLGVRITLDDFGTGYSSLNQLRRLPIDGFKIDKSFVTDIKELGNGAVLVKSIVALAQALGLHVVAEGVETRKQLAFLRGIRCDTTQGFLFTKPLPADEVEGLFEILHHPQGAYARASMASRWNSF